VRSGSDSGAKAALVLCADAVSEQFVTGREAA